METMYTYAALVIAICYVMIIGCIVEFIKCLDDCIKYDKYLNANGLEDSDEAATKFLEIYYGTDERRYAWWWYD